MERFPHPIILRKGSAFHDWTNDAGQALKAIPDSEKIAMINDIAGYGRVFHHRIPSHYQCHAGAGVPVPTSISSNHTGFPCTFLCMTGTDILPEYLRKMRELELTFDGIYCGFLGSVTQIGIVKDFLASQTGNAGPFPDICRREQADRYPGSGDGRSRQGLPYHHSAAL